MSDTDLTSSWIVQTVARWKSQVFSCSPLKMPIMQVEESNKHLRRGDFSTLSCMDRRVPYWMDRMIQVREEEK